ncbi:MAG: hypothetical protein JSV89_15860 [Spirochaetaceae bacterium]|nr:MAG: hypothetical protein JSV89_15860 [Spirochaetaceae bacterium]
MIDSYSFGSITIDGKNYSSDVIVYPDRVDSSWWRKEGHNLCLEDIEEVLRYRPEVLVIGQGKPGLMKVGKELTKQLRQRGIEVRSGPTAKAVRLYNELSTGKKIVAALHLTC